MLAGYVHLILNEVMRLRSQYKTMKKAKVHAHNMLPAEPQSLIAQYLAGKERTSKEHVVASRKSRFSKPAFPTSEKQRSEISLVLVRGNAQHESATAGQ